MNNLVGDVKANPRDFYRYINNQKKDSQGIPPLKRKNGKGVAQSDLEKAEEFNGQLRAIGEGIPIPDSLGEEATFINICIGIKDLFDSIAKQFAFKEFMRGCIRSHILPSKPKGK